MVVFGILLKAGVGWSVNRIMIQATDSRLCLTRVELGYKSQPRQELWQQVWFDLFYRISEKIKLRPNYCQCMCAFVILFISII